MSDAITADVVVAGTGPAGLIAALALARIGLDTVLAGPAPRADDRRTTAIMAPALKFLETLGLGGAFAEDAAPLKAMRIVDATRRLIRATTVTFHAAEIGEDCFGLNIPNGVLNAALETAVERSPGIRWHRRTIAGWMPAGAVVEAILDDGRRIVAQLGVGADGRNSPAREAAGIKVRGRSYRQAALVLSFAHSREHGCVSTEFHTETGPFTQVPLPGNHSSLVWVMKPETADQLMTCDDAELSRLVEERMQSMLGKVEVEPGRQVYPLSALVPDRFAANRIVLVGEAAHVFPPIGAQGLNLGIRDVQDLCTAVGGAEDPGSAAALAAYDSARRPDVLARSGAVNMLNASLLTDLLPAQLLRRAGLGALRNFPLLRGFAMREGLEPGSGFAAVLSTLREQVRRKQP